MPHADRHRLRRHGGAGRAGAGASRRRRWPRPAPRAMGGRKMTRSLRRNEGRPMIRKSVLALAFALAFGSAAQAQEKLTVLLEWFVNPDHAPLVVARELGLFEKAGLEVELLPPADPSIVPRAVASGQAEIGVHYQPNLYLDHAAGVPLVRFGTLVETPLNTLTVLADGPVKDIA